VPGGSAQEDPLLVEIPSHYYYDAMMVKHLNDAKSALILCSEGLCDRVKELASGDAVGAVELIGRAYKALLEVLQKQSATSIAGELVELVRTLGGGRGIDEAEVIGEISSGNYRRLARKALALILEGKSLASKELRDIIAAVEGFLSKYEQQAPQYS